MEATTSTTIQVTLDETTYQHLQVISKGVPELWLRAYLQELAEDAAQRQRRRKPTLSEFQDQLPLRQELSFRAFNALEKAAVTHVTDLLRVARHPKSYPIRGFGSKSLDNLREALEVWEPGCLNDWR